MASREDLKAMEGQYSGLKPSLLHSFVCLLSSSPNQVPLMSRLPKGEGLDSLVTAALSSWPATLHSDPVPSSVLRMLPCIPGSFALDFLSPAPDSWLWLPDLCQSQIRGPNLDFVPLLMLLNCGVGEDSLGSLGLQGNQTSPS